MTTLYQLNLECRHIDTGEYYKEEDLFVSSSNAYRSVQQNIEYFGADNVKATLSRLIADEDGEFMGDGNGIEYLHVGKEFLDDAFRAMRRAQREYEALLDAFSKQP